MCSLFDQARTTEKMMVRYGAVLSGPLAPAPKNYPKSTIAIVRPHQDGRLLQPARWGLVPAWCKEEPKTQPFNARCETVATNGLFRAALKSRRCIIPVARWAEYEGEKGSKTVVWLRDPESEIMSIAGLWDEWRGLRTATMITVPASEQVAPVHNRMIALLRPDEVDEWLDPALQDSASLGDLLRPWDGDLVLERG